MRIHSVGRTATTIVLAALSGVATPRAAAAQGDSAWSVTLGDTIGGVRWSRSTNRLVVTTDSGLFGIDGATGLVAWRIADLTNALDPPDSAVSAPLAPSWAPAWGRPDVAGSGLGRLRMLGDSTSALVFAHGNVRRVRLADGTTEWDTLRPPPSSALAWYVADSAGLLLGFTRVQVDSAIALVAYDLHTGERRWKQDSAFTGAPVLFEDATLTAAPSVSDQFHPGPPTLQRPTLLGHQPPVIDSDSSMILYMSSDGPFKVDLRTGAILWRATALRKNPTHVIAIGSPAMLVSGTTLYVPLTKKLAALDTRDGHLRWTSPSELKCEIVQLALAPIGAVVRGGQRPTSQAISFKTVLQVVDTASGAWRWPAVFETHTPFSTPFVIHGDQATLAGPMKLFVVDLSSGSGSEVASFKLEGGDAAWSVELRPGGTLVHAAWHDLLIDSAGVTRWTSYHPHPRPGVVSALANAVYTAYMFSHYWRGPAKLPLSYPYDRRAGEGGGSSLTR